LKKFLDDARAQRLAIKKEIGMIQCFCVWRMLII
jgi:hypothetical protein